MRQPKVSDRIIVERDSPVKLLKRLLMFSVQFVGLAQKEADFAIVGQKGLRLSQFADRLRSSPLLDKFLSASQVDVSVLLGGLMGKFPFQRVSDGHGQQTKGCAVECFLQAWLR